MNAPVREGEVLAGKYRVDRVLGVGGMGVVVAAHHIELDDKVAIKFLLPETLANAEAVARFAREARAAVRIKSEHVARVSDVGKLENGAPYMVMEYLDGSDLSNWLAQRGALPVEQAVDFVLQGCEAIAEAHALGIVHRDLKPGNLFVVRRADGVLSVKVLDFGISKMTSLTGSGGEGSMTKTSALMGSPLYMSPEQMQSSKNVDARGDIWALGVILYELIAGSVPFTGESIPELVVQIMSGAPTPLRDRRPDAPPGIEAVILRCLEKDRGKRWETVGELGLALLPFASKRARVSVERISGVMRGAGFSASALALPPSSNETDAAAAAGTGGSWGRTTTGRSRSPLMLVGVGATLTLVIAAAALSRKALPTDAPASSASAPSNVATPAPPVTETGSPDSIVAPAVLSAAPEVPATAAPPPTANGAHVCSPDATRCTGSDLQRCDGTGHWGAAAPCPTKSQVCRSGACVMSSPPTAPLHASSPAPPPVHASSATTAAPIPAQTSSLFDDRK